MHHLLRIKYGTQTKTDRYAKFNFPKRLLTQ